MINNNQKVEESTTLTSEELIQLLEKAKTEKDKKKKAWQFKEIINKSSDINLIINIATEVIQHVDLSADDKFELLEAIIKKSNDKNLLNKIVDQAYLIDLLNKIVDQAYLIAGHHKSKLLEVIINKSDDKDVLIKIVSIGNTELLDKIADKVISGGYSEDDKIELFKAIIKKSNDTALLIKIAGAVISSGYSEDDKFKLFEAIINRSYGKTALLNKIADEVIINKYSENNKLKLFEEIINKSDDTALLNKIAENTNDTKLFIKIVGHSNDTELFIKIVDKVKNISITDRKELLEAIIKKSSHDTELLNKIADEVINSGYSEDNKLKLFEEIINNTYDPDLLNKITNNTNDKNLLIKIFERPNDGRNYLNKSQKLKVFEALIDKSNDKDLLIKIIGHSNDTELFIKIVDKVKNISITDRKELLEAIIKKSYSNTALLIKIAENTNDKDLHDQIFNKTNTFSLNYLNYLNYSEQLKVFEALIDKSNDKDLLIKIAKNTSDKDLFIKIVDKAQNISSDSDKIELLEAIINKSYNTELLIKIADEVINSEYSEDNKLKLFKEIIKRPKFYDTKLFIKIVDKVKNISITDRKELLEAIIKKSNNTDVLIKIAENTNDKDLHDQIFNKTNTLNKSEKLKVFEVLINKSNDKVNSTNDQENHRAEVDKDDISEHSQIAEEIPTEVLNATKEFSSTNKNDVFNEITSLPKEEVIQAELNTSDKDLLIKIAENTNNTDIHNQIFNKTDKAVFLANGKIFKDNRKDLLQDLLFDAYNKNHSNIGTFKESLKDLPKTADLDKAFNAMKHVSGGKELTAENKEILKNTETWIGIIEKICHYIAKVFTLGQAVTQKESRDNFNSVTDTFTAKITAEKNNNSGQSMNM